MIQYHSYFSLKYGLLSPRDIVSLAEHHPTKKLLLADINNTSGCLDFVRLAQKNHVQPVIGIDFRNGVQPLYLAIAMNNEGFEEMNTYISPFLHDGKGIPALAPDFKHVKVIYPLQNAPEELRAFEFVGIQRNEVSKIPFLNKWTKDKMVAYHIATFRDQKDFNTHRLLRAMDNNILLSALPQSEEGKRFNEVVSEKCLHQWYQDCHFLITNAKRLLEECSISFELGPGVPHQNKRLFTDSEEEDYALIRKLTMEGIPYRYPNVNQKILDRIELELEVIQEKGFVTYFLIAWKILKYARSKNYFYVGRGSGANSLVAYLLRITDVDPIELDLYFERFINLFRSSPPDFDIDFSWRDREDVTQYIFKEFDHVALLATYNTFQYKSTIRELGKVFGLPDFEIKELQNDRLKSKDEIGRLILIYSQRIHGMPSHLSVHSAGIIISEKPIHYYTATNMPPKGFPITQFDMHIAEDVGLYKFDILGQRGLAKVKDALAVIKYNNQGKEVDIHNIPKIKKDLPSNNLLREGNAIGCFYVESPAMRMLLLKLRVDDYLGLVAASSVIRPGVAQSGMMQEYIRRFRSPALRAKAQKEFPVLYNLMPETFGVMVYQEDVLKVANQFAGLSLAEADLMRRGMSGKFRSREEFKELKKKFFLNCLNKGYQEELVADVWRQVESFAGYAFAKGHSASYAVESYQCLYLKAYYPIEYMVATINNGGGFYSVELYLHEAKKHGAEIRLPCVNHSYAVFTLRGKVIYTGFMMINSLESKSVQMLVEERHRNGVYRSFRDFVNRVPISLEQISLLIRANAFDFTGKDKKTLLWDAHYLLNKPKEHHSGVDLFQIEPEKMELPELWKHDFEQVFDEIDLIGFPITKSPFELVNAPPKKGVVVKDLPLLVNQVITITGYLIHVKRTQTKHAERMCFATFIDQEGEWLDTVHFPQIMVQYPFRGRGCYQITGKVIEEFDYYLLEVQSMKRLNNRTLDSQ